MTAISNANAQRGSRILSVGTYRPDRVVPNAEIAAKLGCSVRTVEQKLRAIRAIWRERGAP